MTKDKKQTKKTAACPTPSTGLNQLTKPDQLDPQLDSLFKSSKFTPLVQAPLPSNPTPIQPTQKNDDLAQKTKTSKTVIQSDTAAAPGKQPTKKSSKKKPAKQNSDPKASVESSYEMKLAIQRAKSFAGQLKLDAQSSSETPKPEAQPIHLVASKNLSPILIESENEAESDESSENGDIDRESDVSSDGNLSDPPIHESLLKKTTASISQSKSKTGKSKGTPNTDETPEQKNARTVFLGNVPIGCVKDKSTRRSLLEHILNPLKEENPLASQTRIESIRFRGIPLATPVADEQRANEKAMKRSQAWLEAQAESGVGFDGERGGRAGRRGAKALVLSETKPTPPVTFLTSGQKRKIGYVTQNFHPEAKSCIAYVVISEDSENSQGLSAQELAKLVTSKADGTSFLDRVLRCDVATGAGSKTKSNGMTSINLDEQRRTLFIGGLDFLEEEDSIRKAVESKLLEEKGGLPDGASSWVERVRVVKDKATSLNKGFAYVLLRSQDAVEEMLALPEESFKIGKRKVRFQKYLSAGKASAMQKTRDPNVTDKNKMKNKKSNQQDSQNQRKKIRLDLTKEIITDYQGPDQSKELANLTKTERKQIKSNNQLRVERRMLKKQYKLKLKILNNSNSKSVQDTQTLKPLKNQFKHKKSVKPDSSSKSRSKKSKPNKPSKPLPKKKT